MRQTEGFLTSIFGMLGGDLTAPDHTTLSRRGQHLALALRRARPGTSLHLLVDSTGLSIVGEGEWAAATQGGRGRRGWRKLHLGVDGSRVIVACALTEPTADDAMTGISLVDEVEGHLTRVTADPAYDTIACYGAAGARGARGRGAADQDRVVVSTGRPIRCPRSDDQEGEGARTATVEAGVWVPSAHARGECVLPVHVDRRRLSSGTPFIGGNGVRPCSRVTF